MKNKETTRYPGVFRLDQAKYWVRAKVIDPRTGKNKEIDRILEGVTAHEAAQQRDLLINETKNPPELTKKVRVGEFAQSWMRSKTLKLDSTTRTPLQRRAHVAACAGVDRIRSDSQFRGTARRQVTAWAMSA